MSDGILSDPLDLDEPERHRPGAAAVRAEPIDIDAPRRRGVEAAPVPVRIGMTLTHRGSRTTGTVVRYVEGHQVVLRDQQGRDHSWRPQDGAFLADGAPVALRRLLRPEDELRFTASGSIDVGAVPARVARASRIYVEGIHDAELLEKVWGDDLRIEGIVVEQMEGADDLDQLVRSFAPGPRRRLGVLLDHLVDGSKETRIATTIDDPDVLIRGHPYVDIWQAIRPQVLGFDAWPDVPLGVPWKDGVLEALGATRDNPGTFWKKALHRVGSYKDLETPLINAVEQLIDFVAIPD